MSSHASMRLKALILSRYRAFKDRHRLEVTPINLIIGKNGSGKSIISRLPVLLASSILEQAEGPLDLTAGAINHAASFQDLVNVRSTLPFTLGVEITGNGVDYGFETTLRYINETRSLSIEKCLITENNVPKFAAEITCERQLEAPTPLFKIEFDKKIINCALTFSGLLPSPEGLPDPILSRLRHIVEEFRSALPAPSYLGPFREEPSHYMRIPNQSVRDLGPRGERALEILADDNLRRGGHLSQRVQDWFSQAMGHDVAVDVTGDQPLARVSQAGSGFGVSFADTGAGLSQCLPLVVQHFAYRAGRITSPVLIVEQPELHLHPAAHGELADLVIESAIDSTDSRSPAICFVETHSEQFIMRIRRRIAEGLSPALVTLWSLNHLDAVDDDSRPTPLRVISFDERGNPNAWPAGVFQEALDDLAAMRRGASDRGL